MSLKEIIANIDIKDLRKFRGDSIEYDTENSVIRELADSSLFVDSKFKKTI